MVALNRFFQKINWDFIGFSTSALCALHCLALPFLLMFGSMGSIGLIHNHLLENVILLISAIIGITSLVPSFLNHHRKLSPLLVLSGGFLLIALSRFHLSIMWETTLTSSGASIIAFSHFLNWKYCRSCCDTSAEAVKTKSH